MEKKNRKKVIKGFITGSILKTPEVRSSLPYALFIALLMFLYIANGNRTQKLYKKFGKLNTEVKELKAKSLEYSELRMTATRRSLIITQLQKRGINLQESLTPPKVIE